MLTHSAKAVAAIVMNCNTGEILALAESPSFDLNNVPRDDVQALLEAAVVFLIALIGSCGLGSLASGWLQDLLLSSVETSVSLQVSLQFTDIALLLGIGSGVVVIAVLLSLLPVIRANPKDILSRMEG